MTDFLTKLDEIEKDVGIVAPDCGDNSCHFRNESPFGGMRTNGGCRCFRTINPSTLRYLKNLHYLKPQSLLLCKIVRIQLEKIETALDCVQVDRKDFEKLRMQEFKKFSVHNLDTASAVLQEAKMESERLLLTNSNG